MGSTIIRQWHLLTLLPAAPRRVDSAALAGELRALGLEVHRRTVQRDLVELASVFPIVADERMKPYGWGWAHDADVRCVIPGLPSARDGAEIELHLRVRHTVVGLVTEGLRGPSQRAGAVHVDGGDPRSPSASADVRARVPDGRSLRHWLFAFADAVEVLAPADVRAELAAKAARLASLYDARR